MENTCLEREDFELPFFLTFWLDHIEIQICLVHENIFWQKRYDLRERERIGKVLNLDNNLIHALSLALSEFITYSQSLSLHLSYLKLMFTWNRIANLCRQYLIFEYLIINWIIREEDYSFHLFFIRERGIKQVEVSYRNWIQLYYILFAADLDIISLLNR